MFNSQRYQKNKSIKKVSPKSRRTAELYKSSHNIGNRTAAERVGSYKETEVALVYPEGFWEAVKIDDGSSSPLEVQSRSRSRSPKSSPRSPNNELSPTRSSRRTTYSPCALPLKKKRNSDSTSSESSESAGEDSDSGHSMRDTKVSFDKASDGKSPSRTHRSRGSRECSEERNHAKKGLKSSAKGASAKVTPGGYGQKRSHPHGVRPRAPRIKRTACLNAAAIVGLLYESEEPSHKKRKVEPVEVEEEEEEDASAESEDIYDLQFDLDLKKALAASLEDTTPKHKKGSSSSSKDKEKDTNSKASCDSSAKKGSGHKDKGKKDKDKDKNKEAKKDSKESKDKKAKKLSKDRDKQDKVKSKKDSSKKLVSKKVKNVIKEQKKAKDSNKSKKKEDIKKKEETSSESESSESEDDHKPEEDIPLWPPPKRMASLNATVSRPHGSQYFCETQMVYL